MQPLTFKHILKFQVLMLLPNPIHLHPISKQNRAQRGEIVFFAMLLFSSGHLQSFGLAQRLTSLLPTSTLVHRRGGRILSTVRTGGLPGEAGASQIRRPQ